MIACGERERCQSVRSPPAAANNNAAMENIGMTETQQRHHGQHQSPLTPRQVDVYLRDGILVVDDLLSHEEVAEARLGLASTLLDDFGVDVRDLEGTGRNLADASSTNGAGTFLSRVKLVRRRWMRG